MEHTFKLRHHWWLNAGLAGLYFVANKDVLRDQKEKLGIHITQSPSGLTFQAKSEEELRSFLHCCYEHIASLYWNISNASQKEKKELIIYDKEKDELQLAPKRVPIPPIQKVISAKSWKAEGEKYEDLPENLKKRVDKFMKETGRKLWGKDKKLLYTLPVCHDTEIKILPTKKSRKKPSICCICGENHTEMYQIAQPIYLLFASSSASQSFHSQGRKPDVVCWECNFLSKFAYECIHYKVHDDTMMIISPNSSNFKHLLNLQQKLGSYSSLRAFDDQYFLKNIGLNKQELLYHAKKPHELLWAFYYDAYKLLKDQLAAQEIDDLDEIMRDLLGEILYAPTEIILIALSDKGQTFITQDLIIYQDTAYVFRLLSHMEKQGIEMKSVFDDLYEPQQNKDENKTLKRNQILKKILNKHSILRDMEEFCFRKIITGDGFMRMRNMLLFVKEYQLVIRGDIMTKDQINVAVNLGKQIVLQAKEQLKQEDLKKIRGDLFKLRKTRTPTDFLNQLNTLQFRYGISVSRPIQEGLIDEANFEDFRAYCVLGALNVYNSLKKSNEGEMRDE